MAISDQINGIISKGRDTLGAVNVVKDFLPEPLQKALGEFINGRGSTGQSNRNINDFKALLNKFHGVARTNMFDVQIPVPPMMRGQTNINNNEVTATQISLLCEQATLPGVSLNTVDIRRYGTGATEKKPYLPTFADQTFMFIGDNVGAVHGFFYKWMNGIIKYDVNPGNLTRTGYNGSSAFEVEYKNSYAVDIVITCYDEADNSIIVCRLYNAFPIFLGDVQLSWADNDQYMRIPVTFTYYNWDLEIVNINSVLANPTSNLSALQKIIKAGTAIQTIASLRRPTGVADMINVVNNAKIAIGGLGGIL
jgi:hypothetical protein